MKLCFLPFHALSCHFLDIVLSSFQKLIPILEKIISGNMRHFHQPLLSFQYHIKLIHTWWSPGSFHSRTTNWQQTNILRSASSASCPQGQKGSARKQNKSAKDGIPNYPCRIHFKVTMNIIFWDNDRRKINPKLQWNTNQTIISCQRAKVLYTKKISLPVGDPSRPHT